ncbi:ATP-binding protein [Asticcacaulis sp. DXS10W]|uniref:ATP-binding protein n=1 Tax=Asticcacaulis currens TaxID=2984210 RepID=A0ABT5IHC5_9CAUL|nr:ATP-binding protein [Asticcacaulis currens]MDC7695595.1 ATP-binding protein [Asticcacaulis currens]
MSEQALLPESIGTSVDKFQIQLSTRFLQHFSEQLYSSPQKAFEELISNGWDAGADVVDIRVADELTSSAATMAVFDNGASMDAAGLRTLWKIAFSSKADQPIQNGRQVVGKFGIGKLATYVLASKLTYICKAADGIIRRVTMDYGEVDTKTAGDKERLISDINLEVFEVQESDVEKALENVDGGAQLLKLIKGDFSDVNATASGITSSHEYGGASSPFNKPVSKTWTLVILSDLKPTGQSLKLGVLRRMLESALPFGSEMSILVNGELLSSSKINATQKKEWVLGPGLDIEYVELEEDGGDSLAVNTETDEPEKKIKRIKISYGDTPYPYVEIPGIGKVTGFAKLFEEKISGGKSDERGASNGFHINVLGRVVNQSDPSFGEENLSHAAWARFRMTVRADGLNAFLTTNREQFRESEELKVFRAFLRRVFNKARSVYDSDDNLDMSEGGDALVKSLGVVSLSPLRNVVSEVLRTQPSLPGLFDESGILDREEKRNSWRENTEDNIKSALGQVKYEKLKDESFVKFRIKDSSVVINKEHPFVVEHTRSKAEKELVRTVAMVSLLSDVYALDIGIDPSMLENIRAYRDKLMRFRAIQRRESGLHIAQLLLQTQHQSDVSKRLELAVSDAIRYLGFDVKDLATSGEPEGIARAYPYPNSGALSDTNPNPPLYTFTFDAKSAKHAVAKTGNISLDGIVEHRDRYEADYALVVAPGFSDGALTVRCEAQKITPIRARDLGRLLEFTVEHGAIPLTKLREMFELYDPSKVTAWVDQLGADKSAKSNLTIDIFIRALEALKGQVPDVLPAGTIALTCRMQLGAPTVKDTDVIALVRGLQIIVPELVGITEDKIVVNASAGRVAAAVSAQLEKLHVEPDHPPTNTEGE